MSFSSPRVKRVRPALGTFVEIETETSELIELGFQAMDRVDELMSFYRPESDIGRLNRSQVGEWVHIHSWTAQVLARALEIQRDSAGTFDIACREQGEAGEGFELDARRARRKTERQLDLGGIAKGFAVDQAVQAMLALNPKACGIVNAGGDLRVFGESPARIALRIETGGTPVFREITVQDAAVATSSTREDHVLMPEQKPLHYARTAVVMAADAMTADALTKIALRVGASSRLMAQAAQAWVFDAQGALEV